MPLTKIETVIFDVAGTLLPCDANSTSSALLNQAPALLNQLASEQKRVGLLLQTAVQLPATLDGYPCLQAGEGQRPAPAPDLPALCALALESDALRHCLLISGTAAGVEAGLSAGMWTVGTALSGSLEQAALAEWPNLPAAERDQLRMQATMALLNAGAHYVIDAIDELTHCLTDIALRLQKGERP